MTYPNEPQVITTHVGAEVPAQTSGKATMGGVGAAIGGILTAIVSGLIVRMTGADLSPELHANILIVCTAVGGALGGYLGAYFKKNYLT